MASRHTITFLVVFLATSMLCPGSAQQTIANPSTTSSNGMVEQMMAQEQEGRKLKSKNKKCIKIDKKGKKISKSKLNSGAIKVTLEDVNKGKRSTSTIRSSQCNKYSPFEEYLCPCQDTMCSSKKTSSSSSKDRSISVKKFCHQLVGGKSGGSGRKNCISYVEDCCEYPHQC
jgi:hypothetical protein